MEVSRVIGGESKVYVRATKDPSKVLDFTPEEWSVFIAGVKAGEFDL